jgi:predicted DNA-binding ArsR family transcriptional regulator
MIKAFEEKRNCKKHGFTIFKLKTTKNRSWYSCHKCLKSQWNKAQEKQRKKPDNQEYHKNYSKENYKIRKSLSIYLTMILLAANIKPE